jgi:hypothetical protein
MSPIAWPKIVFRGLEVLASGKNKRYAVGERWKHKWIAAQNYQEGSN